MAIYYDRISMIGSNMDSISLLVRIVRMWSVPMFNNPTHTSCLDMILADEHGGKIQATVRQPLLNKFSSLLNEGYVYEMEYFNVLRNSGGYKASCHNFRLIFIFDTIIVNKECQSISMFGLNCIPFNDIVNYDDNHDYLIDVMGVLTAVFPERKYVKDGKITRMIVMELTDESGKLQCALFGDYVDMLMNFLRKGDNVQVIVVVQLARVKSFKGKTAIQNSMNATRLMFNPVMEEVFAFRNSIVEHGLIDVEFLAVLPDNSKEEIEAEFMRMHPKKTIAEINNGPYEDGLFVVLAKIMDIIDDGPWFSLECKCNRLVSLQSGVHFCQYCRIPVLRVYPRFKLKVKIADETGTRVVVLFDRDVNLLIQRSCEDLLIQSIEEVAANGYPHLIHSLIDKRVLFKVETKLEHAFEFEEPLTVKRVCTDDVIIFMFDLFGSNVTPTKSVFTPPFPRMETDIVDLEGPSFNNGCLFIRTAKSLACEDSGRPSSLARVKRKLADEFNSFELRGSIGGVKGNDDVQVEDEDVGEVRSLFPV